MKAVRVSRHGGPGVLDVVDVDIPQPGAGDVLVETSAAGINFLDVYQRTGAGKYAEAPPFILGVEGAGRVTAVGDSAEHFAVGDRVAWKAARGSYARYVVVTAAEAVPVPDGVTDEAAAAAMLQGLTAQYLVTSTYPITAGDTVLIHAAAGGVGSLLTQLAKLKGARVLATVSTVEKAGLARRFGADDVIRYDHTEVAPAVRRLTGGEGVDVVYDGVGRATFDASLDCLRPRGLLVMYGYSSGVPDPIDVQRLDTGGSLFLTRPSLAHHTRTREELLMRSRELFAWIADEAVNVHVGGRYPMADVREAHRALEERRTAGKLLLLPA